MKQRTTSARGLTIIEMMVAVAIIAIVVSLAAPSFKRMIEMQRLRGIHDQIVTDLQFARSEAVRTGVPMNVVVAAQSGGVGACYIIFSDRNGVGSAACDCKAASGSRCSAASTAEVKTVQLLPAHKVDLQTAGNSRMGFDPVTGGVMLTSDDSGARSGAEFVVESYIDPPRKLRTIVGITGRPLTCAPPFSTIALPACPVPP